jgi:hypothetical protein
MALSLAGSKEKGYERGVKMLTTIAERNQISCAIVHSEEVILSDSQSALDLIANIRYETDCDRMVIPKEAIVEDFFVLSTGLAGEVLQKFVTYGAKLAIVGDFSKYTSKPLQDFMAESNRGKDIFFVRTQEEAIEKLARP